MTTTSSNSQTIRLQRLAAESSPAPAQDSALAALLPGLETDLVVDPAAVAASAAPRRRLRLLGVDIDDVTMGEALERIDALVEARRPSYVVTPNVDHVVRLQDDEHFKRIYDDAALVLADGMPLVWATRLLFGPEGLRERVAGSDVLPEYCRVAAQRGRRLSFVGGQPGSAQAVAELLAARSPGLEVCQVLVPPFGFEKDPKVNGELLAEVRRAKPDVLFVGLGSPKQEAWVHRHRDELEVPVALGVGAAFDMASGRVRRAPMWVRRIGMEWMFRLLQEPRRLWRRYILEDSRFLTLVAGELLRARRARGAALEQGA